MQTSLAPIDSFTRNMIWQTYTYNAPLTPELEEAFRAEAARALSLGTGSLGYSVSTSFTASRGVTTGSTEFQVGKSTPWTPAERRSLDNYLGRMVPPGMLLGPEGQQLRIEQAPTQTSNNSQVARGNGVESESGRTVMTGRSWNGGSFKSMFNAKIKVSSRRE
ncbi:hypothetical protein IAT38_000228 [Cryptococcus sp. DSM 104549]